VTGGSDVCSSDLELAEILWPENGVQLALGEDLPLTGNLLPLDNLSQG